jgi:uncharacterized protein (TIRG00374 family)
MKKTKPALGTLLKALISLGLVALLLSQLDLSQFYRILIDADLSYLSLAIGAYFVGKLITAARWAVLARALGFENPFKEFVVFYFLGMFFNLFAPTTLGGDAGRVFYLSRAAAGARGEDWKNLMSRALISVAADRVIGLAVLLWIGAVALVIFPEYAESVPWMARYFVFVAAVGSLGSWLLLPFAAAIFQRLGKSSVEAVRAALATYWSRPRLMGQAVLISGLIHFIQTWIQVLLGRTLNVDLPWSYCFIFFPLVDILSALPVSVSGIGIREGGYFFFLGKLGVKPEAAIACGVLWLVIVLVNGLLGGIGFLLYRRSLPRDRP